MEEAVLIFGLFFVVVLFLVIFLIFLSQRTKSERAQWEAIREMENRLIDLMTSQLKEIRGNVDGTSQAMREQISSFTKETVQIQERLRQVQETMKGISSFQEIFRAPKLRGQWGEASLENQILAEYFPREFYQIQYPFSSGAVVDAVLKLPNGKLLAIDAKFPFDNFQKMIDGENEEEKIFYRRRFIDDVKNRIKEIAQKYVLPQENTVDFALMYIPAEAVFYEIMFNMKGEDIPAFARSKKVILTSPNTIYLTLRTIVDWFRDTQISRQTQEILKRLNRIQADSRKLAEDFRRLGVHLKNAVSAYDTSEKRLAFFSDKVNRLLESKKSTKEI